MPGAAIGRGGGIVPGAGAACVGIDGAGMGMGCVAAGCGIPGWGMACGTGCGTGIARSGCEGCVMSALPL